MDIIKTTYHEQEDRYDIDKIKRDSTKTNRVNEKGIINDKADTSIMLHDNGNITIAASKYSNYNVDKSGHTREISLESKTITNRKILDTDELIINKHKLNPQLYELADTRAVLNDKNNIMMNLNITGTVLVKAWDAKLQKYVMIRRPYRGPIFSPILNSNKIPEQMK